MNARLDIATTGSWRAPLAALAMTAVLATPAMGQGLSNAIGSMARARNVTAQATSLQRSADPTPATVAPAAAIPPSATRPPVTLTVAVPTTISAAPNLANTPAVPNEAAKTPVATGSEATDFLDMAKSAVGLGSGADSMKLGLESEDANPASATDLMKNPEMLRLLGDNPRFTYDAAGLQDPMTVPWLRSAAIYAELSAAATAATKANELDKATGYYKRILALGDARYLETARAKLGEIAGKKNAQAQAILAANPMANVQIEAPSDLPPEIRNATTATMVGSGQQPLCMVGSDMLSVGQAVPRFPNVRVVAIEQDKVVFAIKDKKYEVNLAAVGGASDPAAAKGVK